MWPESKEDLASRMKTVHEQAKNYNRTLDYGLRVHMVVRIQRQRRVNMLLSWSRNWMMRLARQSVSGRWMQPHLGWPARLATAHWQIWKGSLSRISGRG